MAEAKIAILKMDVGRLRKKLNPNSGPVVSALSTWARVYRAFLLRRFDTFSRGGGDWPKLSPLTIEGKGSSAILVDQRILRLGLATGIGIVKKLGTKELLGVTFGFISRATHPRAHMSIADLAAIHHYGRGVPKRTIVVYPDDVTRKKMAEVVAKVMRDK